MSEIAYVSDGPALREDNRIGVLDYKRQLLEELEGTPKDREPKPKIDMVGKRFGRLTVLKLAGRYEYTYKGKARSHILYKCRCDCGVIVHEVMGTALRRGNTRSCGCLVAEINRNFEGRERARQAGLVSPTRGANEFNLRARKAQAEARIAAAQHIKVGDQVWFGGAVRTVLAESQCGTLLKLDDSTKKLATRWRPRTCVWPMPSSNFKAPRRIAQAINDWRREHDNQ